jgi:hypothetical protein
MGGFTCRPIALLACLILGFPAPLALAQTMQ